jgi:hypothetical protein
LPRSGCGTGNASTPFATTDSTASIGYQWWRITVPGVPGTVIQARGHDGQYIYIVPELDLVVARNGRYHKADRPAVADPNLISYMPPQNLVAGAGTTGPSSWNNASFLGPIVASITGTPANSVTTHFSAAQCSALDRLAVESGLTRAEVVQFGLAISAALAEQSDERNHPAGWVDGGPCEVTISWSAADLPAHRALAAELGVSIEDLHHGGGRLLIAIILALGAGG